MNENIDIIDTMTQSYKINCTQQLAINLSESVTVTLEEAGVHSDYELEEEDYDTDDSDMI